MYFTVVPTLTNQVISINDTSIELTKGLNLDMDSLEITPIEIEEISLSNFKSDFGYKSGILKDAKMRFEVDIDLHYSIRIKIRFMGKTIFSLSKVGMVDLITFDSGFINVNDATIHAGRMKIDIPQLKLKFKSDSLKVSPGKYDPRITADEMQIKKIKMEETVIPRDMPALFGGNVIPVQNPLEPQDVSICDITMDEFATLGIRLPPFELTNLKMSDIKISKVTSDDFTTKANVCRTSPQLNLFGIVRLWVSIGIVTTLKTDKIELFDLDGNITTDKAWMSGMNMMLKIKDIKIKNMEVENFDAKELGIGL